MCDHLAIIYKCFSYANMLYAFVWSETGKFCLRSCLLAKTLFNVGLFTIWLYLISASAVWRLEWLLKIIHMPVWKFHIYIVKFLLIFDFYLMFELTCVIYTCRVQPCLYGNNSSVCWNWLALSRDWRSGNYIVWTFIISIQGILKLRTYELY